MTSKKDTVESGPRARTERILFEEVGDEAVVYDLDTSVAHALQPLAAAVFAYADGVREPAEIAELCSSRLSVDVTESDVADVISQLEARELLDQPERAGVSRRDAIKVFTAASAGAMLISSIAAPAALAGTPLPKACSTGTGTNNEPNCNPWNSTYCDSWESGWGQQNSWGPQGTQPQCVTTSSGDKCWLPAPGCQPINLPGSGKAWNNQSCWNTSEACPPPKVISGDYCTWTDSSNKCQTTGKWQCVPVDCGGNADSASHCQVVCCPPSVAPVPHGDWGPGCKSGYSTPQCYSTGSRGNTPTGYTSGCWGVYCKT
jgi:hypothetical protein